MPCLDKQNPLIERAADVAFIAETRVQSVSEMLDKLPFAPDFAVEVSAEHDKAPEVQRKTQEYMQNGTRLLWNVYPLTRSVAVHRPGQLTVTLSGDNVLDGYDGLPGFATTVKAVFSILD